VGPYLFFAFIAVPIAEIALLIEIGRAIGSFNTISLIIITAVIGAYLLRRQGYATLNKARSEITNGRFPLPEFFDALCLFTAGLLLLTPGLITDFIGGLLFLPQVRQLLLSKLGQAFTNRMHRTPNTNFHWDASKRQEDKSMYSFEKHAVEGDFITIMDDKSKPPPSG
jgi:UPF0716 protein FxsA